VNVASLYNQPSGTYYDTTTSMARTSTGNAVVNLIMQSTNAETSHCGPQFGLFMTALIVINAWFAGLSSVAVTGRITFALARDNGFPYSNFFKAIHPKLKTPINALLGVFFFDFVLMCINFNTTGGTAAFLAIVGLSSVGFQISYALPILFKMICKQPNFPKTKFDLGKYSLPCGVISCVWLFTTNLFFFFPTNGPVDLSDPYSNNDGTLDLIAASNSSLYGTLTCAELPQGWCLNNQYFDSTTTQNLSHMNWLVVVFFIVVIIATINWLAHSRRVFKGPNRAQHVFIPKDAASSEGNVELTESSDARAPEVAPVAAEAARVSD